MRLAFRVVVLVASIAILTSLPMHSGERRVTLKGSVLVADQSPGGELLAIVIVTEEDNIVVEPIGKGLELYDFVGERVTVHGVLRKDERGQRVIRVERYDLEA